jgi:hypothetical protein
LIVMTSALPERLNNGVDRPYLWATARRECGHATWPTRFARRNVEQRLRPPGGHAVGPPHHDAGRAA